MHGVLQLKVYNGELQERMAELLTSGLCVTINSDDPSYFGGYMNANFEYLVATQDVSAEQTRDLVCNGFTASFLPEPQKQARIEEVHRVYAQVMQGG